jgi:hypothetical protein
MSIELLNDPNIELYNEEYIELSYQVDICEEYIDPNDQDIFNMVRELPELFNNTYIQQRIITILHLYFNKQFTT